MNPHLILLKNLIESKIGPYVLIILIILTVFGGWKGFTCVSQAINEPEKPNEVQDAVIPDPSDYDSLKLPE